MFAVVGFLAFARQICSMQPPRLPMTRGVSVFSALRWRQSLLRWPRCCVAKRLARCWPARAGLLKGRDMNRTGYS